MSLSTAAFYVKTDALKCYLGFPYDLAGVPWITLYSYLNNKIWRDMIALGTGYPEPIYQFTWERLYTTLMGLCHNLCRAFPLNACHCWFNLFLKDCCLRHTEAQVNGNYFYIVYRQMLWAVKTEALSLILYWVSVIVSCFLLLHASIRYLQFLVELNFASISEIYRSHLSCLVHWLEKSLYCKIAFFPSKMRASSAADVLELFWVWAQNFGGILPAKNVSYHL